INGALRIGAKRTRERDAFQSVVVDVFRRFDLLRRYSALDPLLKRREHVVFRVLRNRIEKIAEDIGADAAPAMRHAGSHIEPIKVLNLTQGLVLASEALRRFGDHLLVITDAFERRGDRVAPAVIMKDLAAE